jgi:Carboxypeptidase regulatory-like domain/TonB dependent receptor
MFKTSGLLRALFCCSLCITFLSIGHYKISAQSQALNGQIEGIVTDSSGAAIANASITIKNIETGLERTVISDDSGSYRAPLLPLGTYRVTVEVANFKKLIREGITLTTGQTATINLALEPGGVQETVTVTSDAPVADPGKIDVGRVMNAREVQNLPLVSRNPYNYALLQANVTGRPNSEFGVPRINANGYARRTNYQLDGNNNTQADRAGIRLMPISETFVNEVQLVTNGFAAEFGNTPGLIMNAVTPNGTNTIHGSASYRFRRTAFSSRPFNISPTAVKPKTKVDDFTAAIGGPIIKDRWHYFGGFENVKRGLAGEPQRTITISAANQAALIAAGVPASAFPTAIPTAQKVKFYIVRTDAELNDKNHLTGRYNYFKNISPDNIAGGLNTLQRSIDFDDVSYSVGLQLASTISSNMFNEFRFQYAKRESLQLANANSGTGPSIIISGVANFGAPVDDDTISPLETTKQFLDNLTWTRGNHGIKIGGGVNRIDDTRRSNIFSTFTFPNIQAYLDAKNGVNRRSYTNYSEAYGNPTIQYKSTFYNFFAQDDWKVTRKLKFNYGLRYDLYDIPKANGTSPYAPSQKFKVDKNNFAPRFGIVYGLRDGRLPTVIRASAGIYYDTAYLEMYRNALQLNGNPVYFNFSGSPATAGAPDFPNALNPAAAVLPRQSLTTISPNFKNLYAMHENVQLEQAISNDLSFTVGFIHSNGHHIPVYRNVNCLPVASEGTLADGRLIYGTRTVNNDPTSTSFGLVTVSSCSNRLLPQFQNIFEVDSGGNSTYNAGTFQLSKRFSKGYQFSVNYTLSRSEDDAPERNLVAVGDLSLSAPENREFDRGKSVADQTHTFIMSFVGRPQFNFENKTLKYIVNNNQFGIIATANNGETFNIVTNQDLNGDGVSVDRPVGFERNSGRTPRQFNVDVRYSRYINITERFRVEAFAEAVNIFNHNSIFQFNNTILTGTNFNTSLVDPRTGKLIGTLPDFRTRGVTSLDSRQFQFGFKFIF